MAFNFRVVRSDDELVIYDVYYDSIGVPVATHVSPTYVYGENIQELREQLELMLEALDKPVLDMRSIGHASGGGGQER
ncbi:hypothetical protein [Lysobacter silvisoli]|uniref:Uncharacterized protein n=1 Tax=Lysobacter silvisoli TaxID=2293254 RepID=A0A371K5J1_9GAMM|nr:hypothetical protein [Lysobacter silvisoli]RDZ29138.1 hypothetical protein DX914_08610 [Lysobacter silvisoli]